MYTHYLDTWQGIGPDEKRFIDEWMNCRNYITAHTSGSTGAPKEIRLLKSDMRMSARSTNVRFGITASSRLFCPLSTSYIAGKMMIVRAIEAKCTLIAEKPSNNVMVSDYGDIDLMAVVPSQCDKLIDNPTACTRLKNLIIGGAPLSPETERRLAEKPWNSFATYGMTETCSHVALRRCGDNEYEAMPGIEFDTDGRGCLVINAPEFSFRHLVTNDIVSLIDCHTFRWLGRYDNVINSGGIKIHPEEIEKQLVGILPEPFYIHSVADNKWGQTVGVTLLRCDMDEAEIISLCRNVLPSHAVPRRVRFVNAMRYTSSGKIIRENIK
ncbi:MAG: AMP-binding protein [Muribaculaceae bacterium]|nr:AMP-binding protein [Muribaculaceae bacterium]